ncbi:Actin-related protein 8 [Schistosoma japonicum]|nr:Actin-related protein 8 [Schistosoma japonicum]KAH8872129.1 Actin-related protein 8 [Schistosoma japonicum]
MRNQSTLAENVVIIEPGSFHLRIGRAVEISPKRFPHCIARKPKPGVPPCVEPVINRKKPTFDSQSLQESVNTIRSFVNTLFNLGNSSGSSVLPMVTPSKLEHSEIEDTKLFEWECNTPSDQEFYALNDAFNCGFKNGYHISWPMRYGFLTTSANYTSVLQDLEDIWSTALEKHVGIPRSNLSTYRAILVISDVYKRNEIRHLIYLLLNRLKFGRVFVHQASVCATYGIGLPTACVINIGEQKTSVCCVEDGVAHTETRVILPVGRSDVLRVFHSFVLPSGFCNKDGCIVDINYQHLSDVEDLRTLLENSVQCSLNSLYQQNEKNKCNEEIQSNAIESTLDHDCHNITLRWLHKKNQYDISCLHPSTILLSYILPFACMSSCVPSKEAYCTYQVSSLQSSEPDDPFDDLYISLTTRERRKRGLANEQQATIIPSNEQPETEIDAAEQVAPVSNPLSQKPNFFESLPEAIWWSVSQCANFVGSQIGSEVIVQTSGLIPGKPVQSSSAVGDELRRRLLGCIILTGGGVAGVNNQIMERWLTEQLISIAREKQAATTLSNHIPIVEIISHSEPADLSWSGARLLLTSDLINDLWLTPTEWNRFGSRALREKAPFPW